MTFLAVVAALVSFVLIVTGGTNIDFRDCWGEDRVETFRWLAASWGRYAVGVVLLVAVLAS